jgi:hypothetical protein
MRSPFSLSIGSVQRRRGVPLKDLTKAQPELKRWRTQSEKGPGQGNVETTSEVGSRKLENARAPC